MSMGVLEKYIQLCGEVGNYTEKITGVSIVDAYFGPTELSPEKQKKNPDVEILIHDLESLTDFIHDNIEDSLKQTCLHGEVSSLIAVISIGNFKVRKFLHQVKISIELSYTACFLITDRDHI